MRLDNKKILVLAPHTDDGELACGATLSRCLREGANIHYVAFSCCEESLPNGWPKDTLVEELNAAMQVLGISQENIHILNYRVRYFESNRQKILEDMVKFQRIIEPDIVFMPSVHDVHQDHVTIAKEGLRAFKKKTIFSYEVPWNNYTFNNQAFFQVEQQDAEKKCQMVGCYRSQSHRDYATEESTISLLRTNGMRIGAEYAEVFEVPRMIL